MEEEIAAEFDWLEDAAADKDSGSFSDPRKSESSSDWAKNQREEVCVEKRAVDTAQEEARPVSWATGLIAELLDSERYA